MDKHPGLSELRGLVVSLPFKAYARTCSWAAPFRRFAQAYRSQSATRRLRTYFQQHSAARKFIPV